MPLAPCPTAAPRFRGLFPDWTGPRPVDFFLMEHLLEARRQSEFPTNIAGPDEDVNVYLCDLLTRRLAQPDESDLDTGATPLLLPPAVTCDRRLAAAHYRRHGDHRLFHQGLFGRGDGVRRQTVTPGLTAAECWQRDLGIGQHCYETAANLLAGRGRATSGLAPVLAKLATHYERYVHVLAVLATRRLGLGATVDDDLLRDLSTAAPPDRISGSASSPEPAPRTATMDDLLDAVAAFGRTPTPAAQQKMLELAARLGVEPQRLPQGALAGG